MNTVLGGSMSSRLFQNVREKRGLAYAVFSGLSAYRDAGNITIYAGCANEAVGEVIDLCVEELRGMKQAPVPDAELRRAKDHLKGSLMLSLENTASRMSHLARQEIYFDRHFGLDETLGRRRARHERWTCSASRAICSRTARWRRPSSGPSTAQRRRPRAQLAIYGLTSARIAARPIPMIRATRTRRWAPSGASSAATRPGSRSSSRRPMRWPRPASFRPTRRASCARRRAFDIARIEEIEQITQHDVIAFTTAVAEHVGPAARWLHFGLTSSDVLDTAQALQMREACGLIVKDIATLMEAVRRARRGASPHADDRAHARRARRADDLRSEARALVRRAAARSRSRAARARRRLGRQDLRRRRHVRAPRPVDRAARLRAASACSRRRSRRRSSSAIATRS